MARHRPIEGEVTDEVIDRFIVKTQRQTDGCLLWTAACKENILEDEDELPEGQEPKVARYGVFRFNGRTVYAHRMALYIELGCDPGPSVDHLCYNTTCVEPTHLRGGSIEENNSTRRYILSEYCVGGHERSKENTYWTKDGRRQCRVCSKLRDRKRYATRYEADKKLNTNTSSTVNNKLTQEIADEIRTKYAAGDTSQRKLAREYCVSQPLIGQIVRDEIWMSSIGS